MVLIFLYNILAQGTAEVVFKKRGDAMKAVNEFDGRELDNKTMKIFVLDAKKQEQQSDDDAATNNVQFIRTMGNGPQRNRGNRQRNGNGRSQRNGRGRGRGRGRGGGGRGARRGRNSGRAPMEEATNEDLDAELDAYHEKK